MARVEKITTNKVLVEKKQKEAYTPSGYMSWISKLGSEFLGTAFLVWMIGLLGVTFSGVKFESLISFGATSGAVSHLVVGGWVALDILICLTVFGRWSCDLNPAVTTYRMLANKNSLKFGFSKIGMQILGGLTAGLMIWSTQEIAYAVSKVSADLANGSENTWSAFLNTDLVIDGQVMAKGGSAGRHLIALGGEILGGLLLLWPIFSKSIKSTLVHDIVLLFIVAFGVAALLELGTVGWNPARSLGTNFIFDVIKGNTQAMQIYWAYAIGPIISAFILYFGQTYLEKWVAPMWDKWLKFGQIKDKKIN